MRRRRLSRVVTAAAAVLVLGALGAPAEAAQPTGSPLTSGGRPITGAPSRVGAPTAAEGVWSDTLGGVSGARQTLYYTVHRERADSTLHVSVTTPLTTESDQIAVTLLDAEGRTCASDAESGYGPSDSTPLIATSVAIPRTLDAADLSCAAAGDFVVQVDHGSHGSVLSGRRADVPIELRIREEPPVRDVQSLPVTASTPGWRDPDLTAAAQPVTGGAALDAARVLAPGTYSGAVSTGRTQVFSVGVDFGESLAVAARVKVSSALGRRLTASGMPTLSVLLLSPSRLNAAGGSDLASDAADHVRGSGSVSSSTDGKVVYEVTDAVGYRNRFGSSTSARGATERGRYLVVVSLLDKASEGRPTTVPFVLGVALHGQVAGAPTYTVDDATHVDDAQSGAAGPGDPLRHVLGVVVIGLGVLAVLVAIVLLVVVIRRREASL